MSTGLGAYSVVVEPRFRLVIKPWTITHEAWPVSAPPLKIAILTDIHACEPWMPVSRIVQIVEAANAVQADLIVLLGDYVASVKKFRTRAIPPMEWAQPLGKLKAPLGVYAVLGNHDWWEDIHAVRAGFRSVRIPVLENRALKIDKGGVRFWLAGLGDQLAHYLGSGHRYRGEDDLDGTLNPTMADSDPVILLAHEPDIFPRVPKRVTLTLSGHTHGGQVWLPFVGRPVLPSRYGQRFGYGHVVENGRNLLVSSGLGVTAFPVRFMVPPEIAVVTLAAPGTLAES